MRQFKYFNNNTLGAFYSFERNDYSDNVAKDIIGHSHNLTLYGRYHLGNIFADFDGIYSFSGKENHKEGLEDMDVESSSYGGALGFGYEFNISNNFTMTPMAHVRYYTHETKEKTVGNIKYGAMSNKTTLFNGRMQFAYSIDNNQMHLMPTFAFGGSYLMDQKITQPDNALINNGTVTRITTISNHEMPSKIWDIEGGVHLNVSHIDLSFDMHYNWGEKYKDVGGSLKLMINM